MSASRRAAASFVARLEESRYPTNYEREFPEVVRVEQASSYFDAAEPFMPVVESIHLLDEADLAS